MEHKRKNNRSFLTQVTKATYEYSEEIKYNNSTHDMANI